MIGRIKRVSLREVTAAIPVKLPYEGLPLAPIHVTLFFGWPIDMKKLKFQTDNGSEFIGCFRQDRTRDGFERIVQAQRKELIRCLFRFFQWRGNGNREDFLWRNGKLIVEEDNREIMFLHLRSWIKGFGRFENVSLPFKWHEAKNGWGFTKGHFYLL